MKKESTGKQKNKVFAFLKNPNLIFICANWFLTLAAVAGSIVCAAATYNGAAAYVIYAVAALSLAYSVYTAIRFAPALKKQFARALKKCRITKPLAENKDLRITFFAVISFGINLCFVAFNTVLAAVTKNVWYGSLAGYYLLLSVLRGAVLWRGRRAKTKSVGQRYFAAQLKTFRMCGTGLLILDAAMGAAVTLMVLQRKPVKYTEITAIIFAAYTVYKITLAIVNALKAKKGGDFLVLSLRNISLTDAAISLLSLQTALIATFSEGGDLMPLNAVTGFAVCAITIALGIYMIALSSKKLKLLKNRPPE